MRRLLPVVPAMLLAALLLVPATAMASRRRSRCSLPRKAGRGRSGRSRGARTTPTTAPTEYEPPFLINAAVGLTVLLVVLVVGLGGLYWLLVQRPSKETSKS